VQLAGGHFASHQDFRTPEKVTLEKRKPHIPSLPEFLGSFQFFGEHLAPSPEPAHQSRPFLDPRCPEIDLEDVGKIA